MTIPEYSENLTKRDPRFSYENTVHLSIPFQPWTLRLPLNGVNISASGVFATMNPQCLGADISLDDLYAILNEGDLYSLQLDTDFPHLDSPVVTAEIRRRRFKSSRLELALEFNEESEDISGLIHELRIEKQKIQSKSNPTTANRRIQKKF